MGPRRFFVNLTLNSVPTMLERTKISLGALIRCHTQDNTVTKVEFCEDKSDIL